MLNRTLFPNIYNFFFTLLIISTTFTTITMITATITTRSSKVKKFSYQDNGILLHIIPHTHDDVGWLATLEQYYDGKGSPFGECVVCILDNIFNLLDHGPNRTMTYVEMEYFHKWYYSQSIDKQNKIKEFIKDGRLTFSNGGWVMNDEACAYYDDIIEQMILGHRFLLKEFNYIPKVGWHIDPFGHSAAQVMLFSQMGFNIFFIQRIDFQDLNPKAKYALIESDRNFEFLWRPFKHLEESYILTHVNNMKYGNWYQEHQKGNLNAEILVDYFHQEQIYYKTNNTLCLFGDDFAFGTNTASIYYSLEEMVQQINREPTNRIHARLSSPNDYSTYWYKAYLDDSTIRLRIKQDDDFFPMADSASNIEPGYWTGYYSSKPAVKLNVKIASQMLNNFRKIYARYLVNMKEITDIHSQQIFDNLDSNMYNLERALSILQHHDAVSGTSKIYVAKEYINIINNAIYDNLYVINWMLQEEIQQKYNETITFGICDSNSSSYQCEQFFSLLEANGSTFIRIFNPGNTRKLIIRLKIPHSNVELYNTNNDIIPSDKLCSQDFYYFTNMPDCDLYFQDTFKMFEYKDYKVAYGSQTGLNVHDNNDDNRVYDIGNFNKTMLIIDNTTNFTIGEDLKTFSIVQCKNTSMNVVNDQIDNNNNNNACIHEEFTLDYKYYMSISGAKQSSGAYIFRSFNPIAYDMQSPTKISIVQGILVTQIQIERIDNTTNNHELITRIRLYKDHMDKGIEVESHVFSIAKDQIASGREIIMRIKSLDINNDNIFYTDSNGMQMIQRVYNYKREYNPDLLGNIITGNYYPIGSCIYIEDMDTDIRMSVMNDRAQGGTSLHEGEIEFMIHRRTLNDDGRGLGESLDEYEWIKSVNGDMVLNPIAVRTTHILSFSNQNKNFTTNQRDHQYSRDNTPLILYGSSNISSFQNTNPKSREIQENKQKEQEKEKLKEQNNEKQREQDNKKLNEQNNEKLANQVKERLTEPDNEKQREQDKEKLTEQDNEKQWRQIKKRLAEQDNEKEKVKEQGEHDDDDDFMPLNLKISIRSYKPNEYTVRLHNMDEYETIMLNLTNNQGHNMILTRLLKSNGAKEAIIVNDIQELSLSTNQLKSQVIKDKYVFRELTKINPDDYLFNFNNATHPITITFRPLEIRTFSFTNITKLIQQQSFDSYSSLSSSNPDSITNSLSIQPNNNANSISKSPQKQQQEKEKMREEKEKEEKVERKEKEDDNRIFINKQLQLIYKLHDLGDLIILIFIMTIIVIIPSLGLIICFLLRSGVLSKGPKTLFKSRKSPFDIPNREIQNEELA